MAAPLVHDLPEEREAFAKLQKEYIIIKYPENKRFWQSPKELHFRLDKEGLFIVWYNGRSMLETLSVHRIVAVQRGSNTEAFKIFTPLETERSFSILYLSEKEEGRFAGLKSLDLTCQTTHDCKEWMDGLRSLILYTAKQRDPFVIWLRQLWCEHTCVIKRDSGLAYQKIAMTTIDMRQTTEREFAWNGYVRSFDDLFEKGRLYKMFHDLAQRQGLMTSQKFEQFLLEKCKWQNPFQAESDISFADFLSVLRMEENSAMNPDHSRRVWQEMTHPLSHYFINSSHNTYLEGDQLKDRSTYEAYIYALLQGCRCVEIDCWDDVLELGGEDISVHHGFTFTSKLAFTDVVKTITDCSFHSSEYPVIISIENHCNSRNQRKMAEVFEKIEELCNKDALFKDSLPSPDHLKRKIVLKGTCDGDNDLQKLITYCRISTHKLPDWEKKYVDAREIFDVSKHTISEHCHTGQQDPWMVACTEKHLVRVYPPAGINTDSSNYDPTLFWSFGAQIVSLNFQKPDLWMQLNQGFFRQNGRCGYVLKPNVMRDVHTRQGYSPNTKQQIQGITAIDLKIEIISGQHLCPYWKKCHSFSVKISTYGIPADTDTMATSAVSQDAIWPQWEDGGHVYKKTIFMPELCLVYFNVLNTYRFKTVQYAQNCIPLISLQTGIRFVPLRTPGGTLIPESGLFVHITKEENRNPCVGPPIPNLDTLQKQFGNGTQ